MESEEAEIIIIAEKVRVRDYTLKRKIGEGSFSTVWKADNGVNGDEVAVKQVRLSRLNRCLKIGLDCEINFLSSVNHPNIIRLLDFFQVYIIKLTLKLILRFNENFRLIL